MASSKVHGITIDLDVNASGVSKAFNDINKDIRAASTELKTVDKLLKLNPNSIVLLTQKQDLLTDAIDKTEDKLIQLAKAKKIADEDINIDKNSKAYRELERDIINARNSLEKFNKEAEANSVALQNASKEGNELGKALEESGKSALSFGDIVKGNIASDLIVGGVKALASAFKAVGNAIFDVVKDSAEYADEINTLAKNYNLTTKELQQYSLASELIDVDVNTIAKSMSKLTKNMTSTSSGVVGAFQKLGVATKDSNGSLRDSNEVFNEVIEKLGTIENETEQDSLAMEIFGKSAAELGTLINGGAEQLADFNKYLEENNLILSDEELASLGDLQDSFDILSATFEGVKQKIAAELAPVIQPIIEELTQFIIDHKDDIIELVENVVDYLTSDEAKEQFNKIVDGIDKFVTEFIPQLIKDLPNIKKDIELLIAPIQLILDIINGIVAGVKWLMDNEFLQSGKVHDANIGGYGSGYGMNFNYDRLPNSGGFGDGINSGGFGNVTLNANFNITNGNNIDKKTVMNWADEMTDRISENLGSYLRVRG